MQTSKQKLVSVRKGTGSSSWPQIAKVTSQIDPIGAKIRKQ
ncbi:19865_t:CDS:2 [Cetraspora pellucida]|uniref:19865_t:CDS:1 n=1 Tax=Cetraspora pellucida TaxID=1433469 RepID=A0A9N8VXQ4_9GLOM|nr:19865_t:CDS:2 [Cetraspora pellucida]